MIRGNQRIARVREAGLGLASFLLLGLRAAAGQGVGVGDEPELSPPAEMPTVSRPIVSKPAGRTPAVPATPPAAPRGGPAVLALPGLTTRSARPSPSTAIDSPGLVPDPAPGGPSLDAPIEMRRAPESTPNRSVSALNRSSPPLVLESSPTDDSAPLGGTTSRSIPSTKRLTPTPRTALQPTPVPARRSRFFGLMPGPAQVPAPASPEGASTTRASTPGRSEAEGIRDDPAADSALKRRIEKQARDAVGERARSIEVKVVGKNAVVQARGVKFYQKRGVRKSLETLPALSGLRSMIEVVD